MWINGRVSVPLVDLNSRARHDGAIGPTKETSFGPPGFRAFPAGTLSSVQRGGRVRAPHIRSIFGLDMRGIAQPERLRSAYGGRLS